MLIIILLITFSSIYFQTIDAIIAHDQDVQQSMISYTNVRSITVDCRRTNNLNAIEKCTNLNTLTLLHCSEEDLELLKKLPNLQHLSILNSEIAAIPDLSTNIQLITVNLINDKIVRVEYDFSLNTQLKVLRINNNNSEYLNLTSNSLAELNIQNNNFKNINNIGKLSNLEVLIVDENPLETAIVINTLEKIRSVVLNSVKLPEDELDDLRNNPAVQIN